MLTLDSFYLHTKFGDFRFSHSGDMIIIIAIEKWVMRPRPVTTPLWGVVYHPKARIWCSLPGIKFDNYSFSHSRDIIGAQKFKVSRVTLTTPLLWIERIKNARVENARWICKGRKRKCGKHWRQIWVQITGVETQEKCSGGKWRRIFQRHSNCPEVLVIVENSLKLS